MSDNASKPNPIKGRPVITNIDPMFVRVGGTETTITIEGHGFWDNRDKIVDGIKLGQRVPFYNKKSIDLLRLFAIPHPAANRSDQYNIFTQPLSAYNLYEQSGEPMTSKYPAFTGIELDPITTSQNNLTFKLPPALSSSFVDIIVANRAGYSRSSVDSFQANDQSTVNLTTENIASSGMIMVGEPTYYYRLDQYRDTSKNHYGEVTFLYKQILLFDPFFDRSSVTSNNVYTYKLATDPDMSNVVQTVTSTTFLNTVTYSPVASDTKYYSRVDSVGGLNGQSNIVEQKTTRVTLQAFEPKEEFYDRLTFRYTVSHTDVTNADWQYILAEDQDFTKIVSTRSRTSFSDEQQYVNLTRDRTYWAVLSSSKLNTISNVVSAITNPCKEFVVTLQQPTSAYTIDVSARSEEKIFVTEMLDSRAKGSVTPVANDQFGQLYIAVGEGFFREGKSNTPGRLVFDGGFVKFYGYPHDDMPVNLMRGSRFRLGNWFTGSLYDLYINKMFWRESHRDLLNKGYSIYDGSRFPGQYAYLYNILKFIQRDENKTNRVLYINDFRTNLIGNVPAHGVARFYSTFHDVAQHAGMQIEQLSGYTIDQFGCPKHGNTLAGDTESLSTSAQWKSYLSNYDSILWIASEWSGEPDFTDSLGKNNYLSNQLVAALEDYYDNGGGLFISTDHNYFHGTTSQLLSSYGIRFESSVNRTRWHSSYKIETILNNKQYIPTGEHPLFTNINPGSYLYVQTTEGVIKYNTDSSRLMINSEYTTNTSGVVNITEHNDGTSYTTGKLQVKSATGCVSAFNI